MSFKVKSNPKSLLLTSSTTASSNTEQEKLFEQHYIQHTSNRNCDGSGSSSRSSGKIIPKHVSCFRIKKHVYITQYIYTCLYISLLSIHTRLETAVEKLRKRFQKTFTTSSSPKNISCNNIQNQCADEVKGILLLNFT